MKKAPLILILFIITTFTFSKAQTIGLTKYTNLTEIDYVLFSAIGDTNTFLIDQCGELVHQWASSYNPAMAVYLLPNGNLLRPGRLNNTFFPNAAGRGGMIEIYDWNGSLIWDYQISNTTQMQHHDVEYLPNGNILAIVWDLKTMAEADMAGRDTNTVDNTFWSEKIIEIQPNYATNTGTIVWEWHLWDHLIQDYDNSKNNYGVVSNSPELVDVNYPSTIQPQSDWAHVNGIDYNASLDQIVLSSHNFSELWVIDHSTTTVEAASHSGGNSGKGGDILYRWGNPAAYQRGTSVDQKLFKQHDVRWIEDTLVDAGKFMVFNNQVGQGAPGGNYSSVDIIDPPVDINGNYTLVSGQSYGPLNASWTYIANPPSDLYSSNISGAHRFENGHTLICEGNSGRFFELDQNDSIVWEYINPMSNVGMISQGDNPQNNSVFRCTDYSANYPGLNGQSLVSMGPLELNPTSSICTPTAVDNEVDETNYSVYPNPTRNTLNVSVNKNTSAELSLFNTLGQEIYRSAIKSSVAIDVSSWEKGIYFIRITFPGYQYLSKVIIE